MKPQLLLAVRPRLLCDILRVLIGDHANVVVLDEARDPREIWKWVRKHKVDVVIATFDPTQDIPKLVTELLAKFPKMLVVGINMRQECVRTYVFEVRTIPVSGILHAILQRADSSNGSTKD